MPDPTTRADTTPDGVSGVRVSWLAICLKSVVILGLTLLPCLTIPAPVSGQIWGSRERRYAAPMRTGLPPGRGNFMFCRLWYDASRRMRSGLGWSTDYPAADANFMTRLEELTPTHIARWPNGDPGIAAVPATGQVPSTTTVHTAATLPITFRGDQIIGCPVSNLVLTCLNT